MNKSKINKKIVAVIIVILLAIASIAFLGQHNDNSKISNGTDTTQVEGSDVDTEVDTGTDVGNLDVDNNVDTEVDTGSVRPAPKPAPKPTEGKNERLHPVDITKSSTEGDLSDLIPGDARNISSTAYANTSANVKIYYRLTITIEYDNEASSSYLVYNRTDLESYSRETGYILKDNAEVIELSDESTDENILKSAVFLGELNADSNGHVAISSPKLTLIADKLATELEDFKVNFKWELQSISFDSDPSDTNLGDELEVGLGDNISELEATGYANTWKTLGTLAIWAGTGLLLIVLLKKDKIKETQ